MRNDNEIDPFANLRVAITGGTSGLGLALVRELVGRGAQVTFVARGRERVQQVAQGTDAHGIVGDVSKKDEVYPVALRPGDVEAARGCCEGSCRRHCFSSPEPPFGQRLSTRDSEDGRIAMIAAHLPIQRPQQAKLLVIDARGDITHVPRIRFVDFLRNGDLVVANDAATLPASLQGAHLPSGLPVEVRLASRPSLTSDDVRHFSAVVFGDGDFRTRTEDRPPPPQLKAGDQFALGPLLATVNSVLGHPRLVELSFQGGVDEIWAGLAKHGRPIQYAHVAMPLALWDVWTPIAGPPVAFESPSAGFVLDWRTLLAMRASGVSVATVTHAAGISSTGDEELDRHLPFDEPYYISSATACAILRSRARCGRIVAIGTTVVRALEHAADPTGRVHAGYGLATQRINAASRLCVVDAILSGTHEPATSHYELLRAFTDDETLSRASAELNAAGYRTHEFGDSVLVERKKRVAKTRAESAKTRILEVTSCSAGGRRARQSLRTVG